MRNRVEDHLPALRAANRIITYPISSAIARNNEFHHKGKKILQLYKNGQRDFRGTDLQEAYLEEILLDEANLSEANLSKVEIEDSSFRNVCLFQANLHKAGLRNVDLSGVCLENERCFF